jgi:GNAT superfamily N-acetyltransferase
MADMEFPYVDLDLSRRLERAEAQANIDCVEARAAASPDSGATWTEVAGTYAMFDGARSPLTQTFCLGMSRAISADDLAELERFYAEREAPVFHEVSPLADPGLLPLLNSRSYRPIEFTSILYRPVGDPPAAPNDRIRVTLAQGDRRELWAQTLTEGWREQTEVADLILDLARIVASRQNGLSFLTELEGKAIAAGGLFIHGGVALFAGASTIPSARRQGAQGALLAARMSYAREHGCDLAMMGAQPGSASQRNAERQGFRIAYTRVKWERAGT